MVVVAESSTGRSVRVNRTQRCLMSVTAFVLGTVGLLRGFATMTLEKPVIPARVAAQLDAKGRLDAIEDRKQTLDVSGLPYPRTSDLTLYPFTNEAHQRRIHTEFPHEVTGLLIRADTHLCLPGTDPCISGGHFTVSDGTTEWRITFQLLGSECPSAFQSHLPKSRAFLQRLKILAGDAPEAPAGQIDFYNSLQRALAAEADSLQVEVVSLLRLLLTSYFESQEFVETSAFAEDHRLIN